MISFRRTARLLLRLVVALLLLALLLFGVSWWYFHPEFTLTPGIVYTQRHGHDLTLDVVRPVNPNGIGILVMNSGQWKSDPKKFQPWLAASFLRQGHTIIAVNHLSQPEATIQEIVQDVGRAARFVRHHARHYGIDPNRLGVFGGSSGGHLSLMLATRGGPGDPKAADPVDRESSAVQAATVFYPVTDLLNLGPSTENLGDGGPPKSFRNSFGPKAGDLNEWKLIGRDVSPIFHVSKSLPSVFIIHGDADTLVPLEQSTRFKQRAAELGREVALTIRPGKKHGWPTMIWDAHLFAQWFTQRLR
jgi:acetyl esterase/lipase|uniref:alpha/beta hydrolase fold domain-containing protein n=1 Tax=Prosthecobacter sp. TaxID=1965333 RepID=UPI003783F7B3